MRVGRVAFGVAYFFSLLTGAFGVLLLDPTALTVGASGAVFGLMGVLVVYQRSRGQSIMDSGLGGLLLLNLFLTFAVMAAGWGHLRLNLARFAVTFVLAQLSSTLVEQPCLKLKKRWER